MTVAPCPEARRNWARALASVVAWLALGCGGRALETTDSERASAGRDGTAPPSCAELESEAADALLALVAEHNECDVDQDCVNAMGIGSCHSYCVVPVRRTSVSAVIEAGQAICRAYFESDCHVALTCPNAPAAGCVAGRCTFK